MIEMPAEWVDDALCARTGDPEAFFPDPGSHAAYAKSVCAACPVQTQCLEYVMDLHRRGLPQAGVWAGTTSHERKDLMTGADRICPDCRTVTGPPVRGRNPRCDDCWKERRAETYERYNERRRGSAA